MKPKSIAIVGAAETTDLGVIPDMSQIQLHADAALNAMADAGLKPADIDGIATAGETPVTVAHYLGLTPKWVGPGIALHEDLWPDTRAIGDGLGRAARMGGEEPARHL